jgi:hypothetical protein
MTTSSALCGLVLLTVLAGGMGHPAQAQSLPTTNSKPDPINLHGVLTDAQEKPVTKANITIQYHGKTYRAASGASGNFDIAEVDISPQFLVDLAGKLTDPNDQPLANTTVQFHLYDTTYKAITNELGEYVIENVNLSKSLKEWYIPFFLLIPGIFGLLGAMIKDWRDRKKGGDLKKQVAEAAILKENQFLMALGNAIVWAVTLFALALLGVRRLHFFSPQLGFEFYVPILGFLGALL